MPNKKIKILALQLKHLGDVIMTLPSLGIIKKQLPNSYIAILVNKTSKPLVENHPWVDKVYVLDYKSKNIFKGNTFQIIKEIKKENYNLSLSFDGQSRSALISFLAGIKKRYGAPNLYSNNLKYKFLYNKIVKTPNFIYENQSYRFQHLSQMALNINTSLNLKPVPPTIKEKQKRKAQALINLMPGQGPLIGLSLKGVQAEKSWPLNHFTDVARNLWNQKNARLFTVGTAKEKPLALTLRQKSASPIADFCGRTSILELLALLENCHLFISIDTGTSHLAALKNIPQITVFTWTHPYQWAPQNKEANILCYTWALKRFNLENENKRYLVKNEIQSNDVLSQAFKILESNN